MVQDYPEDLIDWGPKIVKAIEKVEIRRQLELAELMSVVQALEYKKGRPIFHKWRTRKIDRLLELEEQELNVFEKLQRKQNKKANTVFSKLQKFRKR